MNFDSGAGSRDGVNHCYVRRSRRYKLKAIPTYKNIRLIDVQNTFDRVNPTMTVNSMIEYGVAME